MNPNLAAPLLLAAALSLACPRSDAGAGPGGPPPAPAVEVHTMETAEQEVFSDYLATLTARRSVTVFSQVPGYVAAIAARPGAEARAGQTLLTIESRAEQASLENLQATREAQAAALGLARSRLEGQVEQAQAGLKATLALIDSQKARLGYFQILAPFAGVVGHFPVKVGDLVTPATPLTSVTQVGGLEAEVWVPLEKARLVTPSSLVRLLDGRGQALGESLVTFVAPRADAATQLVLLKAAFGAQAGLRPDEVVKARVVWRKEPGLALPASSVQRQAGQAFAFVVESQETGLTVRRVPVQLGVLLGKDYAVTAGLDAGQQVVVSGVQLVQDGVRVELKR
jgi:RND family efflux transporter MFP subunit